MKILPTRSAQRTPRTAGIAMMLSLALVFSGCTSITSVQTAPPGGVVYLSSVVRVGDQVNCTLTDGSHVEFKVTAVETDALVGSDRRVPVADIIRLEVRRFDSRKTTQLVVGIVVVAGVVALAADSRGKADPLKLSPYWPLW